MAKQKRSTLFDELGKILIDLNIASDHIADALPAVWEKYHKDFCYYDYVSNMVNELDNMYCYIKELQKREEQ